MIDGPLGAAPVARLAPGALDDADALRRLKPAEAAEKVEGLFASMLLAEMRKTLPSGSFFGAASGADVYDGLLERTLGEDLARNGGFGLGAALRLRLESPASAGEPGLAAPAAQEIP
ncbi:MAG TPA: rod-binding protein [Planctomycetota bacterium]|nr:rod-binding protein [Planctomycetota bacterium]